MATEDQGRPPLRRSAIKLRGATRSDDGCQPPVDEPRPGCMPLHGMRFSGARARPFERQVAAVLVVVGEVVTKQPMELRVAEDHRLVEQLKAGAAHPSFGDAVPPRTARLPPRNASGRQSNCTSSGPPYIDAVDTTILDAEGSTSDIGACGGLGGAW